MRGAEGPSGRDRWWLLDLTLTQAGQGHGCAIRSNPSAGSSKGVEWDSYVTGTFTLLQGLSCVLTDQPPVWLESHS